MFNLFESILYKTRDNYLAESLEYLAEGAKNKIKSFDDLMPIFSELGIGKEFHINDKYFGIQRSGNSTVKNCGGNLVVSSNGKRAIPATQNEIIAVLEEIKKTRPDAATSYGNTFNIDIDGYILKLRITGGGGKQSTFFPAGDEENSQPYIKEVEAGLSMSNLTFFEEFMTAQLFNISKQNDSFDDLYSIIDGSNQRSSIFYEKCFSILKDINNKLSEGVKKALENVKSGEDFKNEILPQLSSWKEAIPKVVVCMNHKIDDEIRRVSGENKNSWGKENCTVNEEMVAFHPKQLDTFEVDQYLDPTDIVLLNEIYRQGGTHIGSDGKAKHNKLEYNTKGKNPFIEPGMSSKDPIIRYKAIGISLKKPSDSEANAHYIGTAHIEKSTALSVGFDDDGNLIGDLKDVKVRKAAASGYFDFEVSEDFAKNIGSETIINFAMRNKNRNSKSGSITGEANGIAGARGGGLGGTELLKLLFSGKTAPEKSSKEYVYGPAFIGYLLSQYGESIAIPEATNADGALSITHNKQLAIAIAKTLAASLKIPFVEIGKGRYDTVIPSYIKIA